MKQQITRWFLALALFSTLSASVTAVQAAGETDLVGLAMHRETGREIYLGALRAEHALVNVADIATANGAREMEFRIVARRTSIRSLLGGILLQAEVATGTAPVPATVDFANDVMNSVQGSLYTNDSFILRSTDGGTVVALINGQEMARSSASEVFPYFLAGWIEDRGASTAFRSTMLAPDIDIDLRATYGSLKPAPDRVASVSAWSATTIPVEVVAPEPEPTSEAVQQVAAIAVVNEPAEDTNTQPEAPPATALPEEVTPVPADVVAATEAAAAAIPASPASTPSIAMARPKPVLTEVTPTAKLRKETAAADPNDITRMSVIEYSQRLAAFNTQVFRMVNMEIRYPRAAIRRNIQGSLELDITLSSKGELLDIAVGRSSGHSMLDKSALKAANDAFETPLGEAVDEVAVAEYSGDGERLVIPVPVNFVLTE
ncbi:energy transducer TonB [Parahaliea maris]|uniref:Energy transducer TonB n=1 Tax=Parahaliea maris TaxID=2716870 RepID=A0A5C9A157_9GAMM|nr:energy transducer TonB [Parahaliea maris]TXS93714.1 energy transducer TonB [Parahaliea maris]